jgi:hypothetical protein
VSSWSVANVGEVPAGQFQVLAALRQGVPEHFQHGVNVQRRG